MKLKSLILIALLISAVPPVIATEEKKASAIAQKETVDTTKSLRKTVGYAALTGASCLASYFIARATLIAITDTGDYYDSEMSLTEFFGDYGPYHAKHILLATYFTGLAAYAAYYFGKKTYESLLPNEEAVARSKKSTWWNNLKMRTFGKNS